MRTRQVVPISEPCTHFLILFLGAVDTEMSDCFLSLRLAGFRTHLRFR